MPFKSDFDIAFDYLLEHPNSPYGLTSEDFKDARENTGVGVEPVKRAAWKLQMLREIDDAKTVYDLKNTLNDIINKIAPIG